MEYDDDSPLGEHVGEFGLCGCSSDELRNAFLYVLNQLHTEQKVEYSILNELILNVLNDKDLAEHGGNACYSWLTNKGKELCARLFTLTEGEK